MANLKEIRNRIKSVKSTQQMTSAMKMVAAAKLRKAQDRVVRLRPYAGKLQEIMGDITGNLNPEDINSPFADEREIDKVLLVVVTSNRGLCGAFNMGVCKQTELVINEQFSAQQAAGNLSLLCMGKKGYEYFNRRQYNMVGENHDVFANLSFENVLDVANMILTAFEKGDYDRVELVYSQFQNVMSQPKVNEQFLPVKGNEGEDSEHAENVDYIFEPGKEDILADLIPKSLRIKLYQAVLESNAGEQGARMTAMDAATENAEDLLKALKLSYNQARQAAITTEILEIVSGAEALGG